MPIPLLKKYFYHLSPVEVRLSDSDFISWLFHQRRLCCALLGFSQKHRQAPGSWCAHFWRTLISLSKKMYLSAVQPQHWLNTVQDFHWLLGQRLSFPSSPRKINHWVANSWILEFISLLVYKCKDFWRGLTMKTDCCCTEGLKTSSPPYLCDVNHHN